MKIKIKLKHLVYLLTSIIAFILLFIFILHPQISLFMAKKKLERGEGEGKAEILTLLQGNLPTSQKWTLIEEHIIESQAVDQFNVIVGPSFSQFDEGSAKFTADEKVPLLEEYVATGPINWYLTSATTQLAAYYMETGDFSRANNIFEQSAERFKASRNEWDLNELLLEQTKMLMHQGAYEEAEQILEQVASQTDSYYLRGEITLAKAKILLKQGKKNEALKVLEKGMKNYEVEWEKENETNPEPEPKINDVVYEQLLHVENYLTKAIDLDGDNITVRGKITYNDGTVGDNVGVFLREANDVNRSIGEDEPYQTITNEDGEYEFHGVIPGNYQLFLGFTFEQIDGWTWPVTLDDWIDVDGTDDVHYDVTLQPLIETVSPANEQEITDNKVTFSWQPVEGASYYNLHLGLELGNGGSASTSFKTHIKTNEMKVPIDELYAHATGTLFAGDSLEEVSPKNLLAFTNTKNRFFWSVEAYKANGELLSESNGYRLTENSIGSPPLFYLKEREMTKADHLLLNGKAKEALAAYKVAYEKNKNDIHSIRMITRLIRVEATKSGIEEEKLALPYLLALAEKGVATSNDLFTVMEFYYETRDWDNFEAYSKRYKEKIGGAKNLDSYDLSFYASALMKQEKLKEARNLFKKALQMDKGNRFIGTWLAVEIYEGAKYEDVLQLARTYPERPLGDETRHWTSLVSHVQKEAKQFDRYEDEFKEVLLLYFKDDEEELDEWLEMTEKTAMKNFIEAVKEVD